MSDPAAAPRSGPGFLMELQRGTYFPYPSMTLHLYACGSGMRIMASLWPAGELGRRRPQSIAEAVWQPKEVTEVAVVEWAYRALRKWLEDQLEPEDPPPAD